MDETPHAKVKEKGFYKHNSDSGKYIATLATKAELKAEQDKIVKLQVCDSIYFLGKSHFEEDGAQNNLVF